MTDGPSRRLPKQIWDVGPRRWLVTGGAGFIGSHLVDALVAQGGEVRVLDDLSTGRRENLPPEAQLVVADVADREAVGKAMTDVDGCFHLAAIASVERANRDWIGTHRVNLTGTLAVFDAVRARRIPVVYASSAAVYGAAPPPLPETAQTRPLSAYGADKLGCELHAAVARTVHGVPTLGLRFFNVYGPRQDPSSPYSGVISVFCDRLRRGTTLVIHGDGCQCRDFVYVDDVVHALLLAMRRMPAAPALNVCTGRATSVRELAETLAAVAECAPSIAHGPPRAGDIRDSLGDPVAARRLLGFVAETPLAAGLSRTYAALAGVDGDARRRAPEAAPGRTTPADAARL